MFPFTVYAKYENSTRDFYQTFMANRPKGLTWYAYNVVVKSPTEVEFVVFDMEDMATGGIGDEIGRFEATVDASVTLVAMTRHAHELATLQLYDERVAEERRIVAGYAAEILQAALVDANV